MTTRIFCIALISCCMAICETYADLYCDGLVSIDWKIDSCEGIIQVKVVNDNNDVIKKEGIDQQLTMQAVKSHKPSMSLEDWNQLEKKHQLNPIKHITKPQIGDEWLLFVRTYPDQPPKVYTRTNLTRPLEYCHTGAVTGKGEILKSKEAILKFVAERVKLNRKLPPGCQREIIDRARDPHSNPLAEWLSDQKKDPYLLTHEDIAPILGGVRVPIDVLYWSESHPENKENDTIYMTALVPADPEYVEKMGEHFPREFMYNYPKQAVKGKKNMPYGVFLHAKFSRTAPDPISKKLYGRWNLLGKNETIELDLHEDGTCQINIEPRPHYKRSGQSSSQGIGCWTVLDNHFWIFRSHTVFKDHKQIRTREFFPLKLIKEIKENSVVLENGPQMVRP